MSPSTCIEVKGHLGGVGSLLSHESQALHSGCHTWRQMPYPLCQLTSPGDLLFHRQRKCNIVKLFSFVSLERLKSILLLSFKSKATALNELASSGEARLLCFTLFNLPAKTAEEGQGPALNANSRGLCSY